MRLWKNKQYKFDPKKKIISFADPSSHLYIHTRLEVLVKPTRLDMLNILTLWILFFIVTFVAVSICSRV